MKALFALVLSWLVLCGCNPRPYDHISGGNKEWIIKIEQPGLRDISFSTNDPDCVRYHGDNQGYHGTPRYNSLLVIKPNGEQIFVSGTARITRKEVK